MNVLELDRVGYSYPGSSRPALTAVDLRLAPGERVLLTGASGSGKSTLLRTANGLVPHFYGGRFSGRAVVMGLDTRQAPPQLLASHVGMVFQDLPARFLTDSVEDEIAFSLELSGSPSRRIAGEVAAISERMGVTPLIGRRLEHLSAGEQARLAITAALARGPSLLLLDEPVTHIDPEGSMAVADWVRQLSGEQGVTVLLAEHRLETWRGMIERSFHLAAGDSAGPGVDMDGSVHRPWAGWTIKPRSLTVRGLHLTLGRRRVLGDLDLDLAPGELLALVGRNGSGKTTLLRALAGLQRPEAGQIAVDGKPIVGRRASEIAAEIGFVPQAPASMLFADTVEDEIRWTLRRVGETSPPQVDPWLKAFGLQAMRLRYPRDLSAGERQRLALAAILAGGPPIVLLDEPTLGMDRRRLAWLGRLLRDLCRQGCSVLVATHDPGFIVEHADRAALLEQGRIVAEGPPERVLQADAAFAAGLARWRAEASIIAEETGSGGNRHADG